MAPCASGIASPRADVRQHLGSQRPIKLCFSRRHLPRPQHHPHHAQRTRLSSHFHPPQPLRTRQSPTVALSRCPPSSDSLSADYHAFVDASACRAAMFAVELRLTAVAMVTRGDSHARVCHIIGCSRATLARWLTYYRFNGSVWADADRENSHRDGVQFNEDLMSAINSMARHDPLSMLSEHSAVLQGLRDFDPAVFGNLNCSTSTVSRCLRRLGFTRKRIERLFRERNDETRAQHCQLRRQIPSRCIVSVDETHTDGADVFHLKGWAPRQEKLRILDRDPRSVPRTSTVMAVSGTGALLGLHSCVLTPS